MAARAPQPVFRRFATADGEELWLRRDAVDVVRASGKEETDVELRGGQHFLLKGDTGAFGTIFFGTADSGELEA
jgi:uncharacterized protein YndB with AHSA1/START domain